MSSILPLRPSIDHTDRRPRSLALTDDAAADVLSALQSETARCIVNALSDEPATATDLAGLTDTSAQNVHHHLQRLCDAGVVVQVDTWYSSRGVEMAVYDLATDSITIDLASDPERTAPAPVGASEDSG